MNDSAKSSEPCEKNKAVPIWNGLTQLGQLIVL